MSKVAVVYWTGTGNTETMANLVAAGAREKGAEVDVYEVNSFSADKVADYDAVAMGCPAMGAEELEDSEFAPVYEACKDALASKKVALFGSYGWGDGEWLRTWEDDAKSSGITLACDSVAVNEEPDSEGEEQCKALGAALA